MAERTGWTLGQIGELTPEQLNSVLKSWTPEEEFKPSSRNEILGFKRFLESAR